MKAVIRCLALSALIISAMSGCSSYTRDASTTLPSGATTAAPRFGTRPVAVQVTLTPNARDQVKSDTPFDTKALQEAMERQLSARQLLAGPDGTDVMHLNIEVTDIRMRGTGSEIIWGVLAGNDHIDGTATLLDSKNQPVDTFKVSAVYASDHLVDMQTEGHRTDVLYQKFADQTMSALDQKK